MEAVMIAGAAALAVAGFYSVLDFLTDAGYCRSKERLPRDSALFIYRAEASSQRSVKKMSRLHI